MSEDLELERWQSLWQVDVPVPSGLREMAARQQRRTRTMFLLDIVVTVFIGGAFLIWVTADRRPSIRAFAIWVWILLLAAWIFRWTNRWINGDKAATEAAPNVQVFIRQLRTSYQATLRNLKFGWVLGAVQLLVNTVWVYREVSKTTPLGVWQFVTLPITLAVWMCVLCLLGWTVWLYRKLHGQLESVQRLQEEMEESTTAHESPGYKWPTLEKCFDDRSWLLSAPLSVPLFRFRSWRKRRRPYPRL
jgi:hypothetical protein